jgi:DNA-directed RNA polymerase subunit A"
LQGVQGINRTIVSSESETYKVIAEGENFLGVLTTPGICTKRSSTNNIAQISKVLGIEAARYQTSKKIVK